MRITTNIMALNAHNNMTRQMSGQARALERLSSGFRINRAADDPAGLIISEKLRSQIGGMKVARRNAQDAISMVQTGEGHLTEVHAMLQRVRDLSLQAANDSNDEVARGAIQAEINQLGDQIDNIILGANFNGVSLFGGGSSRDAYLTARNNVDDAERAYNIAKRDKSTTAEQLGTLQKNYAEAVATWKTARTNAGGQGTTLNFQVGANSDATNVFTLKPQNMSSLIGAVRGVTAVEAADVRTRNGEVAVGAVDLDGSGMNVMSHKAAKAATDLADEHIDTTSRVRGEFGASQNRLEHTINSIKVTTENLVASESRIRDADMASEMMNLVKHQIMLQAGMAMMAQANNSMKNILSILG